MYIYTHACTCKKLDQWLNQVTKLFFWRSPNEGTKLKQLGALQFCPNLKAGIGNTEIPMGPFTG